MRKQRYFLDVDNDCHWYLVKAEKAEEWEDWINLNSDDPKSWSVPDFALMIYGNPNRITFENPKDGEDFLDNLLKEADISRERCSKYSKERKKELLDHARKNMLGIKS